MKDIVKAVVVLTIGGTIYTVSQADIVNNFANNTGLSQQEAEQYVENIAEDDLASFNEMGEELLSDGQHLLNVATEIDCTNYEYDWESYTMTCSEGQSQIRKIGNSEIDLGRAYKVLDTEDASKEDISLVIEYIDRLNTDFRLEIVSAILDPPTIDELMKINSYNKSLLQAALDSD